MIRQALGHGERGVTELNDLPRRDPLIKRWVDAIEVKVAALQPPHAGPAESSPATAPKLGADSSHQSATNSVANRPPYLRLVK